MKNRPEFSAAEDSSVLETSFKPNPPKFEIQLPKKKKSQQKKKEKYHVVEPPEWPLAVEYLSYVSLFVYGSTQMKKK